MTARAWCGEGNQVAVAVCASAGSKATRQPSSEPKLASIKGPAMWRMEATLLTVLEESLA